MQSMQPTYMVGYTVLSELRREDGGVMFILGLIIGTVIGVFLIAIVSANREGK